MPGSSTMLSLARGRNVGKMTVGGSWSTPTARRTSSMSYCLRQFFMTHHSSIHPSLSSLLQNQKNLK